jgi:GNAT superfamily N-acetyltransferase
MDIEITNAVREDLPDLIRLVYEFAAFERLTEWCRLTEAELDDVLFGKNAFVDCLIARDGTRPVAYAIFYPNFASFRGQKGVYLEDIYIDAAYRGNGIGEKMLVEIAGWAKDRGCRRIDFQVLDWNTPAASFYFKHGAVRDDDERHFKFVDEAFDKLAGRRPE